VNGVRVAGVDLYAPTTVRHRIVYVASGLSMSLDTLEVRVTGTKNGASTGTRVDVDAILRLDQR
jgi:hypothetical protein